ncbi:(deoxy)nucleoside triphosphate pyrophosphohydrolase [candidate division KSB1 bacterium]|nr:(deoxy)nucleoside triphosphate pyrophosphohydrolase [candidate division KSB1 bacterium]
MKPVIVTCAIISSEGRVLITRRSESMSMPGMWEFPGGKTEEGESPEDAIKREIAEELSLNIRVNKFLAAAHFLNRGRDYILKAFDCEIISGKIDLKEHSEYRWCPLSELKNYQFPQPDIVIIEKLGFV